MVDSLPELSRIREASIALPSSLWAFHHDPSCVVVLTPPDPHPLSTPTLATHPRCECRNRFDGSRGLHFAWRRVFTPVYGPPSETLLASDTGVSCSCSMTPIISAPDGVRWGPASSAWLLPPSIAAKGLDGASLTVFASVRYLRGAFTADALPEKCEPLKSGN